MTAREVLISDIVDDWKANGVDGVDFNGLASQGIALLEIRGEQIAEDFLTQSVSYGNARSAIRHMKDATE
jgi:hypothetical protein